MPVPTPSAGHTGFDRTDAAILFALTALIVGAVAVAFWI